jgi:hypothetical protein
MRYPRVSRCVAALAAMGLLACRVSSEEPSPDSVASREQGAGGELSTNILRGRARLTNQNPQIQELLAESPTYVVNAQANSTQPSGYSASTADGVIISPQEFSFDMLVEAGAGGADGVHYSVSTSRTIGGAYFPFTAHPEAVVRTPDLQPGPSEVLFEDCVGVLEFSLGADADCSTPVGDRRFMSTSQYGALAERQGKFLGYIPGGAVVDLTVYYNVWTGSDSYTNTQAIQVSAACDEIRPVCIVAQPPPPPPPPPPTPELGAVSGPWELAGEPVISRRVSIRGGPDYRYSERDQIDSTPSAPVSDPSTWWSLGALAEGGGYDLYSYATLGPERGFMEIFMGPMHGVSVLANQTTPIVKVVDGQARYPFVMEPAYFHGAVRFVDPYVAQHPGAPSSLQSLLFASGLDSTGDGLPDHGVGEGTHLRAVNSGGSSYTSGSFPQRFDPASGELAGSYELVLANPYNIPQTWHQDGLLFIFDPELPGALNSYRLHQTHPSYLLGSGERARVDHVYCFNEVQLDYWTALGRLVNPWAQISGGFSGTDWRGLPAAYSLSDGFFYGAPRGEPAPRGSLRMSLPQGTYSVARFATMVNENGQTNSANFAALPLVLGCGQRLKIVPPHTVSIAPMNGCADSAVTTVSGIVRSSATQVDRLWYQVDAGPEVTLCTNCGIDPTFSFTVPLQACANELRVFAFSEGMPEASSAVQQIVWDDPSDGPTCAGSTCVAQTDNRPPVARCRDVTVAANGTCGGCGSVNDGSSDPDPGDSITCEQSPECPSGVGSRQVMLTCTDAAGLSSSCTGTVTVQDQTPPVLVCPAPIVVAPTGPEGAVVTPGAATVSDACSTPQVSGPQAGTYPPGTTEVTYTATDAAGNQASCTSTIQVSEVGPEPSNVTLANLPRYTGNRHLTLWGFATSGPSGVAFTQVFFTVDGGASLAPTVVDANSGYNAVEVDLTEGSHVIEMVAIDALGGITRRRTTVTVDLTPPDLTVLSPLPDEELADTLVEVTSSVMDATPTRVVTQWVQASELETGSGTVTHTVDLVNRGGGLILVSATDAVGNTTQVLRQVFILPAPLSPLARGSDVASREARPETAH